MAASSNWSQTDPLSLPLQFQASSNMAARENKKKKTNLSICYGLVRQIDLFFHKKYFKILKVSKELKMINARLCNDISR